MPLWVWLAFCFGPGGAPLWGQETELISIRGRVIDAETRKAIEGVNVLVVGTVWGTATDERGGFVITNVPSGRYTLQFTHVNYDTVKHTRFFSLTDMRLLQVELVGRALMIGPVEVVDTLQRRFHRGAYIIRREEILKANPQTFGQVVRELIPRTWVTEEAGNLYISLQLRPFIRRFGRRDPNPLIIIDGMKIGNSPIGLAQLVQPSQIQNMEVLLPPEAEVLYGGEARYGVIIIETVRGEETPQPTWLTKVIVFGGIMGSVVLLLILLF